MPDASAEVWRYSRINDLDLDSFEPETISPVGASQVTDELASSTQLAARVVTVNGFLTSAIVDPDVKAKGITVAGPDEWSSDAQELFLQESSDIFGVLNTAFTPTPILIDIPRGVVVEHPIVITHHIADASDVAVFPRVVVRCGESAQARVFEFFVSGDDQRSLVVPITQLEVDQAGNLDYIAVQTLNTNIWQIALQRSRVQRDATLNSTTVALGGEYARVRTNSHLVGAGATSNLRAVYFGTDNQMHDFRTLQAHDAPKTTSDLLFKGAVGDNAQSVYSGLIRVTKGAAGTNAFQTNRNLVLSPGAHADSVPNLEIEENDVKCSHASAVGPIDEDQRYYLESRGVPTDIADRLIVLGFLDEIIAGMGAPALHHALRAVVSAKLDTLSAN